MYPQSFDHNDTVADELYSSAAFIANKGGIKMSAMVYLAYANDPNASEEQKKKEKEYKKYIDEHIDNVHKAWEFMKRNKKVMDYIAKISGVNISFTISALNSQIKSHDMSKFSLDEWEPYRMHHHPANEQEKIDSQAAYEKAWEHHYTNNLHHWNWWAYNKQEDKMPLNYVIEMCCDWIAMSMKFGGDAYHWYLDQKDIVLGTKQNEWLTNILTLYYSINK